MRTPIINPLIKIFSLTAIMVAGTFSVQSKVEAADRHAPVKVMSFNIRYGAANDGENSWKHRDYLVLETIKNYNPDLIGYQEALKFQVDILKANLDGYGFMALDAMPGLKRESMCH